MAVKLGRQVSEMGSFEVGIIILVLLTAMIIACTVILYPGLRDLIKELKKDI